MNKLIKCPNCKHNRFLRSAIERPVLVKIIDNGKDGMTDEDIGMNVTEYTYVCAKCYNEIEMLS